MISLIKLCLRTNTRAFKYIFQYCIYVYGVEYDTYVKYHKSKILQRAMCTLELTTNRFESGLVVLRPNVFGTLLFSHRSLDEGSFVNG